MEPPSKRSRTTPALSTAATNLKPDDVRRLIAEVRARPYLWDYRRPDHRDIAKTRNAWTTIAQRLGICSADEWRRTWKNKRDYYNALVSSRRAAKDTWPFCRLLTFLDDVLNPGASSSPSSTPPVVNGSQIVASPSPVDATHLLNLRIGQQPTATTPLDQDGQSNQEDEAFGKFVATTLAGIGDKKKRKVMLDIHKILVEAMDD